MGLAWISLALSLASVSRGVDGSRWQEPTSTAQVAEFLRAAGALPDVSPQPKSEFGQLKEETPQYYIRMFEKGGQIFSFRRRDDYFKDFPFSKDKPDVIKRAEDAESRIRRFMDESGLGWEEFDISNTRLVLEHNSRNFTNFADQRRVYDAFIRERPSDQRRGYRTLRTANISIDAQYGHILLVISSYLPPAGPWRLTVSAASAREAASAAWAKSGLTFRPEQLTVRPQWIRTNTLFDYQPNEMLVAGWVVEVRQNPTDAKIAGLIWVHGETGQVVYNLVPTKATGE